MADQDSQDGIERQALAFGNWLAKARGAQGLTQAQAAARAGVSRVQWARWEAGSGVPKRSSIPAIARAVSWPNEEEAFRWAGFVGPDQPSTVVSRELVERIRRRREELDMTQEEVARRMGMNTFTYGNYERGRVLFGEEHLRLLSEILDAPVSWMFGEMPEDDFADDEAAAWYNGIAPTLRPAARAMLKTLYEQSAREKGLGRKVSEEES